MKTLQRITAIMSRRKPAALIAVGGELMTELKKHRETLDERIATIELGQTVALIDAQEWKKALAQIQDKTKLAKDNEKHLQSLQRLQEIANENMADAIRHLRSFVGKTDELEEIRKRVVQAILMIEVENNVRSVTVMNKGKASLEAHAESLQLETREIRRLLYATDGLMEITKLN